MRRVKLRSIPPANRQKRSISSMRAATASGMVFVGPAMGGGSASRQPAEEPFEARVIEPNPEVQQARQDFQKALAEKAAFWQKEIATCIELFGVEAVEKLKGLGDFSP